MHLGITIGALDECVGARKKRLHVELVVYLHTNTHTHKLVNPVTGTRASALLPLGLDTSQQKCKRLPP